MKWHSAEKIGVIGLLDLPNCRAPEEEEEYFIALLSHICSLM